MNPIEKKRLGNTGLEVTRLGLGCTRLGEALAEIPRFVG
jgi:aryl-alcohol dehydrogenase-like predicted oxidoreductase